MAAEVALLCGDQPGFLRLHPERLNDLLTTRPIHELFEVEEEPFARGKYAAVRRCRDRETGEPFAAKFLRKRRRSTDLKSEIVHEVAVLEACSKCPRIVRLYRVLESDSEMVLVLELAPGGELQMLLDRDEVPEEPEAARLMAQILDGIAYLHSMNVAHLDIKPQNLVLTGEFPHCDVKLCDFGISRYISKGADIREILGTPDYVAPEVLNYEPISLATDMWSVGVLLYVLLTGCSPFGGDTKQETFCNISQSKLDFPADLFGDISEEAIDLIQKLLVKEPSKRLTAQECLKHEWFCKFSNGVIKHPPVISPVGMPTTPSKSKTSVLNGNPAEKKNKPAKEDREESPISNSIITTAQIKGKSPVKDGKPDILPIVTPSTEKSGKVEVSVTNDHGISPVRRNGFAQNMNNILKRLEDVPKSPTLSTPLVQRTKALAMRTMPANATYTFIDIDKAKPRDNQNENKVLDANTNKVERHFPPARQKTDCIYKIRRCYIEDTDEEDDDDIPPPLPPSQPPSQQLLHGNTHLRLLSCATSTSPAPSSSSGCSSGSSSAEGHSDHSSDASSDATSEISGDSSSDRSSIISIDDTLDIPCSKRMSLFPASYSHSNSSTILCDSWESSTFGRSKHRMNQINQRQLHITALRNGQTSVRQVSQRWERECIGSWQTAFNRFQSSETQVQHKDLKSKSTQSNLLSMRSIKKFDGSVPFGLNEIGTAKKCSVQLERENNGNVVVIRELNSGKYSRFSEVKCESIQARIRKLQGQGKS